MGSERRRAIRPGARDDEVDVAAFGIHVREPALRVVVGHARSDRLARDHVRARREESAIALRSGRCAGLLAGHARVAELLDRQDGGVLLVVGVAAAGRDLHLPEIRREIVHAVTQRRVGVPQQHVHRRVDVRVRIDHTKSVSHRFTWGAPTWPPTPPNARSAPGDPWRSSITGLIVTPRPVLPSPAATAPARTERPRSSRRRGRSARWRRVRGRARRRGS